MLVCLLSLLDSSFFKRTSSHVLACKHHFFFFKYIKGLLLYTTTLCLHLVMDIFFFLSTFISKCVWIIHFHPVEFFLFNICYSIYCFFHPIDLNFSRLDSSSSFFFISKIFLHIYMHTKLIFINIHFFFFLTLWLGEFFFIIIYYFQRVNVKIIGRPQVNLQLNA